MLRTTIVRIAHSPAIQNQRLLSTSLRLRSSDKTSTSSLNSSAAQPPRDRYKESTAQQSQTKSMAQLDEELREKLEDMSGEGGASGIELENGKPVAMKRGVRDNMFRLI